MNQFTEGGHIVPVKTDQEWMIYIVIARTRQDLYAGRVQNLHNPRWWMEHTWSCKGHPADPKATVALWPVFFWGYHGLNQSRLMAQPQMPRRICRVLGKVVLYPPLNQVRFRPHSGRTRLEWSCVSLRNTRKNLEVWSGTAVSWRIVPLSKCLMGPWRVFIPWVEDPIHNLDVPSHSS